MHNRRKYFEKKAFYPLVQFQLINIVSYTTSPVSAIYRSLRNAHDGRRLHNWCRLPWFCLGLWLRQPQISFDQNEVLRSYGELKHIFLDHSIACFSFSWTTFQAPRSTSAALCGWWKNGNSADTEHEPSQFSSCCIGIRSILLSANISQLSEMVQWDYLLPRWVWPLHPCVQISHWSRGSGIRSLLSALNLQKCNTIDFLDKALLP